MMGERTLMQEALFYEFNLEQHVRPIICFARSTGSSTWQASERICALSTATSAALRSIRN